MKVIPLQCEYLTKRFHFIGDCNKKAVVKWINKEYKEVNLEEPGDSDGSTWYFINKRGRLVIIIWVQPGLSPKDRLYTIMHEVGHAIFIMMKRAGVDPTDSLGEHFVYLQEYLTEQIVDKLKNKPKLDKKKKLDKHKK